jgi:catechol 2,3-dioxygenase-like lactoylglutathione lyase family enzyme
VLTDAAPVAFIPSTDLDRSRFFYVETLGLRLAEEGDAGLILDIAGTKVWVVKVGDELRAQPFTIFGWQVDDLDGTMAALAERGIEFLRYDGFGQDEAGVWTAPSGTRIAWFEDPEGNNLSLNDRTRARNDREDRAGSP